MSLELIKSQQQSNKELLAEKKSQIFTQNISSDKSISATNHTPMSPLEKLRTCINKAYYLKPSDILLSENVRANIDISSEEFISLKNSIAQEGILQPVVVELRERKNNDYSLIAVNGHRRILASQQLGLEKIMCVIKSYTENDTRLLHGLTENLLRSDLEPLDIAEGYAKLINLGWTGVDVAEYFGRNTNYIHGIIRIASYPPEVKKIIRENKEKFSMRVLINDFAKKSWKSSEFLLEAISKKVENKERVPTLNLKAEKNRKLLEEFYQSTPPTSEEVKNYVEKALKHFKFI